MSLPTVATDALAIVRAVGPAVALLGVLVVLAHLTSMGGRARLRLARRGLSGGASSRTRRLVAGTLIPLLGIAALTVSIALEKEVREGPNRMIARLQRGADDQNLAWIMQAGTGHFMDTSRLPAALTNAAASDPARFQVLYEQLALIERPGRNPDTGLVLGLPQQSTLLAPAVTRDSTCTQNEGRCLLQPGEAVADADLYPMGTRLWIRDRQVTVTGHTREPYSLINRAVLFTRSDMFRRTDGTMEPAYAVLSVGPDSPSHAQRLVASTPTPGALEVLSPSQLQRENTRFWAGNGTPLILLMIALSATFCGVALYAARRALQQREHVVLGALQSLGLRPGQASSIDLLRATLATLLAAVGAAPVAYVLVHVTNAGMIGFHAPVEPIMVAAAAGLIIFANLIGTAVLWARLRSSSVVEALNA